jgi:hypothetical protein
MPEIRLSCPKCSQRLAVSTDALRSQMSCLRCGAEFLPLDVIPPGLTLPAMPVVSVGQAATPGNGDELEGATAVMPTPSAGETPAVAEAGPVASAEPPPSATPPGAEPPGATPPPSPFAVLRPKADPGGSPGTEIASFAAGLKQTASRRVPWAVGYEHVAGVFAILAGLALLGLALTESTPIRVVFGVLAALLLAIALGSVALFALARRASPASTSSPAPTSARAPASSAHASLSSLTGRSRAFLAAGAAAVIAVSAAATGLLAVATATPKRAPARVAPRPASVVTAEPEKLDLPPEKRADYKLKREGHAPVSGGVLYVPPSFRSDDGVFDLLVHFHGNTQLVEESVGAAKVNALVYVVNVGTGSGVYEDRYALPATFDDALTRVRDAAEKRGLAGAKMRRLALSSWSAGYGAIAKIIAVPKNFDRIDALLMLDGLHVAYMDPKTKAGLDKARLGPFIRFAKEAAEGRKLFSITHGDTETHGYASTGEAADALLREVGADRSPATGSPPKVAFPAVAGVLPKHAERWLDQTSEAHREGFRVRGYVGKTPEHHMAHLIQMSVTVLPELAERWQ